MWLGISDARVSMAFVKVSSLIFISAIIPKKAGFDSTLWDDWGDRSLSLVISRVARDSVFQRDVTGPKNLLHI